MISLTKTMMMLAVTSTIMAKMTNSGSVLKEKEGAVQIHAKKTL